MHKAKTQEFDQSKRREEEGFDVRPIEEEEYLQRD